MGDITSLGVDYLDIRNMLLLKAATFYCILNGLSSYIILDVKFKVKIGQEWTMQAHLGQMKTDQDGRGLTDGAPTTL